LPLPFHVALRWFVQRFARWFSRFVFSPLRARFAERLVYAGSPLPGCRFTPPARCTYPSLHCYLRAFSTYPYITWIPGLYIRSRIYAPALHVYAFYLPGSLFCRWLTPHGFYISLRSRLKTSCVSPFRGCTFGPHSRPSSTMVVFCVGLDAFLPCTCLVPGCRWCYKQLVVRYHVASCV